LKLNDILFDTMKYCEKSIIRLGKSMFRSVHNYGHPCVHKV
jgi:hypothetical protein